MSRRRTRPSARRRRDDRPGEPSRDARDERPEADVGDWVSLVPRDPDWALVIWEIGAEAVGRARERLAPPLSKAEMQLRVYALGAERGRLRPVHSMRVDEWIGHRLVLLQRPGRAHQAAVGFVDAAGAFVPAARSAVVRTPFGGHRPNPAVDAQVEPGPEGDEEPG